jgi:hypothetical protein
MTGTYMYIKPTWETELDALPIPTCTVARDCQSLEEAYSWRLKLIDGNSTASGVPYGGVVPPSCSVIITPTNGSAPLERSKCSLEAGSYEAYFWPTPTPAGRDASYNLNSTLKEGTPTTAVEPRTTVVSLITMTSPYVCHLLRNVTIYTVWGRPFLIGAGYEEKIVYRPATAYPPLTLSQPSSSILFQSKECHRPGKHGATRCTISNHPDFAIQDLFTVKAKNYYGETLSTPTIATICQAIYSPTIALVLDDLASQNGIAKGCKWTWEHSGRTSVVGPDVLSISTFSGGKYHPIIAGKGLFDYGCGTAGLANKGC